MSARADRRPRRRRSLRRQLTLLSCVIVAIPVAGAALAIALMVRAQLMVAVLEDMLDNCEVVNLRPPGLLDNAFRAIVCDADDVPRSTPHGTVRVQPSVRENLADEGVNGLSLWPFTEPETAAVTFSSRIDQAGPGNADVWSFLPHSLAREQRQLNTLVLNLVGAAFLVVGLVGATAWITVGRVIRPVEEIRTRVAAIATRNLSDRVPVPRRRTEIADLAETMNDTLSRLEEAVIEQQRFVADASHELRTPITVLRSQLEIALAHPGQLSWPRVIADALVDTERLQQLATDLLLMSQLDATAMTLDQVVDLTLIAREQGALRKVPDHLTLRYDLAPAVADVRCRPALLGRLVRNLLDNAERYADSLIVVRITVQKSVAVLEVADDGPGVPPADRERVFERFTRLDDARPRHTGGTGLGLAIARRIAVAHQGTLDVTNSEQGATFTARLPLVT